MISASSKSLPIGMTVTTAAADPEKYARESFTLRRMTTWQVWSLTGISAAIFLAAIVAAMI